MNRKQLTGLIAIATALTAVGATGITKADNNSKNEVLLSRPMAQSNSNVIKSNKSLAASDSSKYKMRITTAFIGIPPVENGFAADPNFNPNGFSSSLNKKLYEYENSPANQTNAMDEAITLHNGNPENTCVYFQSSCLRAIGVPVPNNIAYTTHLENYLQNNGWQRGTNFNYIQKGDICFAGPYHTFLFMGWKDKSKGIAYVMGDEAYMFNSSYEHRNLNGQTANEENGWNNQYRATCFWKYTGNFDGKKVENAPVNKWIGRVSITSPVGLWMNSQPSGNSSKITCIGNNIILNVIESKNGWYKVYYDGNYGWICGKYTTGIENQAVNKSDNVENINIPSNVNEAIGTTVINSLEGLELNDNPSMSSNGITSIPNNVKVYVFNQTNNGWEKVYYNGNYGWIYSEYTTGLSKSNNKVTSSNKNQKVTSSDKLKNNDLGKVTITSTVGLWMTKGPKPYSGNITCLNYNTTVNVIGESNGWYKINYNGQIGWIDGAYTTSLKSTKVQPKSTKTTTVKVQPKITTKANATKKVIGQDITIESPVGLWMTRGPKPYSGNITCIPYNTKVLATAEQNGWYKISYNGQSGWVDGAYTSDVNFNNSSKSVKKVNTKETKNNDIGKVTVTSTVGLWMTKGPKAYSGNITCLNYNTTVNVIGESNGWYEINYNGEIGWIDGAYTTSLKSTRVQPKSTKTATVKAQPKTTTKANVSKKATGQEITIESPVGLWMTRGPKPYSGNITCIPYNTKVLATAKQNGWYKINYNDETGWVDGTYTSNANLSNTNTGNTISHTKNKGDKLKKENFGQVTVTSTVGLWMTKEPKAYSGNITCLNYNTTVSVIGESNGWYEINYNGEIGWIDGAYTTSLKSTKVQPKSTKTTTVKAQPKTTTKANVSKKATGQEIKIESPVGLWMTKGPKPYSGNITCIPYNTKVRATAEQNGWYKISYNGESGWVDGDYTTSVTFSKEDSNVKKLSNKTIDESNNKDMGTVTIISPIGLLMTANVNGQGGIITCLSNNITVNVIGENSGWYKISYDGKIGWIDGAYTTKLNNGSKNSSLKDIVVASPIGLYMTYGINGTGGIVTCLPYQTKLQIITKQNDWYKVNYNGQVGWVDGAYCKN